MYPHVLFCTSQIVARAHKIPPAFVGLAPDPAPSSTSKSQGDCGLTAASPAEASGLDGDSAGSAAERADDAPLGEVPRLKPRRRLRQKRGFYIAGKHAIPKGIVLSGARACGS